MSASPHRDEAPLAVFGRYRVMARLGRGGMADVFVTAAEGAAGVRKLAVVKRLRTDLLGDGDPEAIAAATRFRSMFLAEAQLSAHLNHPNIVHTYEVGEEAGSLFIAMEYVEGQSLHSLQSALKRQGRAVPAAMGVRIVCEVLSALHYAHELADDAGNKLVIAHRDVSPQNVMLTYDGGVKLVDFGVAKAAMTSHATEVGTIKGKVRYMAPEQVSAANVDRRADVFAAGVVLWELLANRRLVRGETDAHALLSLVQDEAPSLLVEAPAVDPALAAVVMRALRRDRDQRYATALEMRTALEAAQASGGGHGTGEAIGALVRETFASERAEMADRVRKALALPANATEGVLDWAAEGSLVESGSNKSPAGSERHLPNEPHTLSTVHGVPGLFGVAPPFVPSPPPPPPRKRSALVIPLVVFLAAAGGAAAVVLVGGSHATPGAASEPRASGAIPVASSADSSPSGESRVAPAPSSAAFAAAPKLPAAASPADKLGKAKGAPKEPSKRESAPAAAEAPADKEKGFLTLDTFPWTRVSLHGKVLGTTPLVRAALPPGTYTLTLENPEEKITEHTTVTIKSGETVSKRMAF